MILLANNVLITPNPSNKVILLSGIELFLDTRFEEQKAAPQSGIVVAVPQKLTELSVKSEMELQVGDHVIFHFNSEYNARRTGKMIGKDILVPYDLIYVAIRKGEVICLNGGVIVEPVSEIINSTLHIPSMAQGHKSRTEGIVVYASEKPIESILDRPEFNTLTAPLYPMSGGGFGFMDRFVEPGDRVVFHDMNAIPLQHYHEINGSLSKKLLYRMQHHNIEMVTNFEPCEI